MLFILWILRLWGLSCQAGWKYISIVFFGQYCRISYPSFGLLVVSLKLQIENSECMQPAPNSWQDPIILVWLVPSIKYLTLCFWFGRFWEYVSHQLAGIRRCCFRLILTIINSGPIRSPSAPVEPPDWLLPVDRYPLRRRRVPRGTPELQQNEGLWRFVLKEAREGSCVIMFACSYIYIYKHVIIIYIWFTWYCTPMYHDHYIWIYIYIYIYRII